MKKVEDNCQARVRRNFTVEESRFENGRIKEKHKKFHSGQLLKGRFVEIHGKLYYRSGKFLLNPAHFDSFRYEDGYGPSMEEFERQSTLPYGTDLHDPHFLLSDPCSHAPR